MHPEPRFPSATLCAVAGALAALFLGAPATALGDTYVTEEGSNANPCTTELPCRTLRRGVERARELQDSGVVLGPGWFENAASTPPVDLSGLTVSGAGPGKTFIAAALDLPYPAVSLRGSSLNGATVLGALPGGVAAECVGHGTGAVSTCALNDVVLQGRAAYPALEVHAPGANNPTWAIIENATLRGEGQAPALRLIDSQAEVTTMSASELTSDAGAALDAPRGGAVRIDESTLTGGIAAIRGSGLSAQIRRSRLAGRQPLVATGPASGRAIVALSNSFVLGDEVVGIAGGGELQLNLSHVTMLGSGGTTAPMLRVAAGPKSGGASLSLYGSILSNGARGTGAVLSTGLRARASIQWSLVSAAHSDGGAPPALATGTSSAAPQFADPARANYELRPCSPGIDMVESTPPTDVDFYGSPRVVDGNTDGKAAADAGADELERPTRCGAPEQPSLAPRLSAVSLRPRRLRPARQRRIGVFEPLRGRRGRRRGAVLRFSSSQPAIVQVRIHRRIDRRWRAVGKRPSRLLARAGGNARRFTARVARRPLRRGRYRLVLTPIARSGDLRGSRTLIRFRVVRGGRRIAGVAGPGSY